MTLRGSDRRTPGPGIREEGKPRLEAGPSWPEDDRTAGAEGDERRCLPAPCRRRGLLLGTLPGSGAQSWPAPPPGPRAPSWPPAMCMDARPPSPRLKPLSLRWDMSHPGAFLTLSPGPTRSSDQGRRGRPVGPELTARPPVRPGWLWRFGTSLPPTPRPGLQAGSSRLHGVLSTRHTRFRAFLQAVCAPRPSLRGR